MDRIFTLSTKNLINGRKMYHEEDFSFVLGDHLYKCNRFLAGFLSPIIANLSQTDSFFNEYKLKINDERFQFKKIMQLINFGEVQFNQIDSEYLIQIGNLLGNKELINEGINLKNQRINLSIDLIILILQEKVNYDLDSEEEINFISKNLYEIKSQQLLKFNLNILEKIFSNPNLKIEDEDFLFNLIFEIIQNKGEKYIPLLGTIMFQYLSQDSLIKFINNISLNNITTLIWNSICQRLLNFNILKEKNENQRKILGEKFFNFEKNQPLNGIFNYLTKKYGDNPHLENIIEVTASSSEYNSPYEILNYNWEDYWYSKNISNSYILFDFQKLKIRPCNYTLKTHNSGSGYSHIKNWILEGSNDLINWNILDQKLNNFDLNKKNSIFTFECKSLEYYKYIKLKQVGKNHHGGDYLCLSGIEFFGGIIE